MLSNNTFLESRLQRLIFVEKLLDVHVQRIVKMRRCLYIGGNFVKQNYLGKKSKENYGPYLQL